MAIRSRPVGQIGKFQLFHFNLLIKIYPELEETILSQSNYINNHNTGVNLR